MSFDAPDAAALEPVKQKLSRLKRAVRISTPNTTAQQQLSHLSHGAPQALVDKTNNNTAKRQSSPRSPELSPEKASSGADSNPASSPNQPSAELSANSDRQPGHASCASENSGQPAQMESEDALADQAPSASPENDYWDSEDELEAELTRRERAEGFHADSATSSGRGLRHMFMDECCATRLL